MYITVLKNQWVVKCYSAMFFHCSVMFYHVELTVTQPGYYEACFMCQGRPKSTATIRG